MVTNSANSSIRNNMNSSYLSNNIDPTHVMTGSVPRATSTRPASLPTVSSSNTSRTTPTPVYDFSATPKMNNFNPRSVKKETSMKGSVRNSGDSARNIVRKEKSTTSSTTTSSQSQQQQRPARVEFCSRTNNRIYGAVNCLPHNQEQNDCAPSSTNSSIYSTSEYKSESNTTEEIKMMGGSKSGMGSSGVSKIGPVLLELRQIDPSCADVQNDPTYTTRWTSHTVARSRGLYSLGMGVTSTCLSFRSQPQDTSLQSLSTSSSSFNFMDTSTPVQCATGLSSGSLCIHTFKNLSDHILPTKVSQSSLDEYDQSTETSHSSKEQLYIDSHGNEYQEDEVNILQNRMKQKLLYTQQQQPLSIDSATCPDMISLDYFHSNKRFHKPASAVAWKCGQSTSATAASSSHVAIGIVAEEIVYPSGRPSRSSSGMNTSNFSNTGIAGGDPMNRRMVDGGGIQYHKGYSSMKTGVSHRMQSSSHVGKGSVGKEEGYALVWDIEAQSQVTNTKGQKQVPLHRLAHNDGVASLTWMSNSGGGGSYGWGGDLLAIGCQRQNIQLYDLRVRTNSPPTSYYAHKYSVNGISVDPNQPNIFASFSHAWEEPVKLWDLRKDACIAEIEIKSTTDQFQTNFGDGALSSSAIVEPAYVSAIAWEPSTPGLLGVVVDTNIKYYDTKSNPSRPVLSKITHSQHPIQHITFPSNSKNRRFDHDNTITTNDEKDKERNVLKDSNIISSKEILPQMVHDDFSNRILVVQNDRSVNDLALTQVAPIGISRSSGRVMNAVGGVICERDLIQDDISVTMARRAKSGRYSMNVVSNIQLLVEEELDGKRCGEPNGDIALKEMWSWVDRIEFLCSTSISEQPGGVVVIDDHNWPGHSLVDSGIFTLLRMDDSLSQSSINEAEKCIQLKSLNCKIYTSSVRRSALTACGWDHIRGSSNLVTFDEENTQSPWKGNLERAAALLLWRGYPGNAVDLLQQGADLYRRYADKYNGGENQGVCYPIQRNYAETLELVAMCIAGFNPNKMQESVDPSMPRRISIWRRTCENTVLKRQDLNEKVDTIADTNEPAHLNMSRRTAKSYLRAACVFLLQLDDLGESQKNDGADTNIPTNENGFEKILNNELLSLADRVAFACNFLHRKDLELYLQRRIQECTQNGNLEGLLITGLNRKGIKLLCSYLDLRSDIQTVALLVSRLSLSNTWVQEHQICFEWVEIYREILNGWRMWSTRAMFDVGRADLSRQITRPRSSSNSVGGIGRQHFEDTVLSVPSFNNSNHGRTSTGRTRMPQQGGKKYINRPASSVARQAENVGVSCIPVNTPPQLLARCNYCNTTFSLETLKRKDGIVNQNSRKIPENPILKFCPNQNCRKPLPRCAICLLPMGCLNPFNQIKKEGNSRNSSVSNSMMSAAGSANFGNTRARVNHSTKEQKVEDLSVNMSMPFTEWFTWCIKCKHGGHAHHMVGWFAKHKTCPVSNCNCNCSSHLV